MDGSQVGATDSISDAVYIVVGNTYWSSFGSNVLRIQDQHQHGFDQSH
jgi:hypothetical protein